MRSDDGRLEIPGLVQRDLSVGQDANPVAALPFMSGRSVKDDRARTGPFPDRIGYKTFAVIIVEDMDLFTLA